MYITLISTFDRDIDRAIELGKTGIPVRFERDGEHNTRDLEVLLKFQEAGFVHRICSYRGKFEKNAICVEFIATDKARGNG